MEELELGHELPLDQGSLYRVMGSVKLESSAYETLAKLQQFLGDHEANSKIKRLPSVQGAMTNKETLTISHLSYPLQ